MHRLIGSVLGFIVIGAIGLAVYRHATRSPAEDVDASDSEPAPEVVSEPTPHDWVSFSPDGQAQLEQRQTSPEGCELTCTRGGGLATWSSPGCAAKETDFRFVSNDCERVVIVLEYPEKAPVWRTGIVATTLLRGEPEHSYRAADFMRDGTKIRETPKHFQWLAGVLGHSGRRPRYLEDGTGVEFDTIDQQTHRLLFENPRLPAPMESHAERPAPGNENSMYRWTSEDGSVHVALGLSNVPARYRHSAVAIESEGVQVVANDQKLMPVPRVPPPKVITLEPARPRPPQKPAIVYDGFGPDGVYRNESGENYFEWVKRRTREGPMDTISHQPRPISCHTAGGECRRPTDCCSQRCVNSRCAE